MFDEKDFLKNSKTFFLVLVFFSFFFLFLNIFNVSKGILEFGFFLTKPLDNAAVSSSNSVKNFLGVFDEVKTLRGEYFDLQEQYLKLQAQDSLVSLLYEENLTLKKQLGIEEVERELILAEVLFQDWALRNESLLINKGYKDGVKQGEIVSIGSLYIGSVSDVYDFASRVRLPTSRASSLKVMILTDEVDFEESTFDPQNYLSGVAIGYSNILKIENIETNGDLQEGFVIVLNDEKVGTHLYLGNVNVIEKDPTATLRTCSVKLPVNYADLKYVFVRRGE